MLAVCTDLKANGATEEHIKMFAKLMYRGQYDEKRTLQEWGNIDPSKTWQCETLKAKLPAYVDLSQCEKCEAGRKEKPNGADNKEKRKNTPEENARKAKIKKRIVQASRQDIEETWIPAIMKGQDDDEITSGETKKENAMGLNKQDAEPITEMHNIIQKGGHLSDEQVKDAKHRLPKYWRQFEGIENKYTTIEQCEPCGDSDNDFIKKIESAIELFHDETQNPYARILIDGHHHILKVGDREFKRWLSWLNYRETGKALGSEAINSSLNILEAIACWDCKEHKFHNRLCWHDGAIWYDLGNWEAIKITTQGYNTVKDVPILFRKYSHQNNGHIPPLIEKDDVRKVLDFVNIKDEKNKLLFMISLVSYFIPNIPHVILIAFGEKGAAKSTMHKIIKALVDPSSVRILSLPKDKTEFIQQLSHHYYAAYTNITKLHDW